MTPARFYFEDFELDPEERRLLRTGAPVELNGRYLDALSILVRERGKLVSKDRFFDEIWRGTPVTDEALTQCIRTLRRCLGDKAGNPRFIETVPKHGYRFIAPVETGAASNRHGTASPLAAPVSPWRRFIRVGAAGTAGGGAAGLIGGLLYGFAVQPAQGGAGGLSVLLVLICLTFLVAVIGGAGVSFGIALSEVTFRRRWLWMTLGGAGGGLTVGGAIKLIGVDASNLLFGYWPGDITGAMEGAILGACVGLGAWLATISAIASSLRRGMVLAGLAGGVSGLLISYLGGQLMGGSLDLLAGHFPDSRLDLGALATLFGENSFGPVTRTVTAALEGALFAACTIAAMMLARRQPQSRAAV